MKIAVIGGGGREHALIQALRKSPRCTEIIALPGNGGIAQSGHALCIPVNPSDVHAVCDLCVQQGVEYAVVAPDDPLALGLVDLLAEKGIPAFGPSKAAARIEASKVFAKNLMEKYHIPTAGWHSFTQLADALHHVQHAPYPLVIKADGLALGKGVIICQNLPEAQQALHLMMEEKAFGKSGSRVVIEEFLTGPEVSVLAFADGTTLVPMVSSMDHKRALDNDQGPNTGGMGAVAPNPFYTPEIAAQCMEEIFLPTLRAMQAEGCPFKGCLYFGLMLTPAGPRVIEYNCRFGDPETQAVLPLLQTDLAEIMLACTEGRLVPSLVGFSSQAAACVVLASGGYPAAYPKGLPISGTAQAAAHPNTQLTYAGTALQNGSLVTAGGRVLGVTSTAPTLAQAVEQAYAAAENIVFEGMHYRKDIGSRALSLQ